MENIRITTRPFVHVNSAHLDSVSYQPPVFSAPISLDVKQCCKLFWVTQAEQHQKGFMSILYCSQSNQCR